MIATSIKNPERVKAKHDLIRDAAVRLIHDKGFEAMTMRDLSTATGIALGNLYAYIGSKDDVLFLVHQGASEALAQNAARFEASKDRPELVLRRMIEAEFDIKHDSQDLVMLMYRESHKLEKSRLAGILAAERTRIAAFERVIRAGIEAGVFRAVGAEALAHSIVSTIDGWVLRRWTIQKKLAPGEMKAHLVDMAFSQLAPLPRPTTRKRGGTK
jgi:AcrR family transcriptional regulator